VGLGSLELRDLSTTTAGGPGRTVEASTAEGVVFGTPGERALGVLHAAAPENTRAVTSATNATEAFRKAAEAYHPAGWRRGT